MLSAVFPSFILLGARDSATHVVLSRGEKTGLALDALAGLASMVAAKIVLVLIFRRIYKGGWSSWEALDVSVIALFVAEFIQGMGHVMDLEWVIAGTADTGAFCTAQGLVRQVGGTCVALATLTIAIQTFVTIWLLKQLNRTVYAIVIGVEFSFVILFAGISFGIHTKPPKKYYATPTPYWCWLGKGFSGERIGSQYVWFWLTLFVSLALYPPLFLLQRGVIKEGTSWYSPRRSSKSGAEHLTLGNLSTNQSVLAGGPPSAPRVRPIGSSQNGASHGDAYLEPGGPSTNYQTAPAGEPPTPGDHNSRRVLSRGDLQLWSTILYPTLYCIVILPLSVVRWIGFREEAITGESHRRPVATFIVIILFTLSGVFNALLYPLTRPGFFQWIKKGQPTAPTLKTKALTGGSSTNSTTGSTGVQ